MFPKKDLAPISFCLACGSPNISLTLDLGEQPLANSYKDTAEEEQKKFPLAVNHCSDCFHVQLTHAVNPDLMFKDYLYVSGTSKTMKAHFEWFADYVDEWFYLCNNRAPDTILDIGCNDGSQLDAFKVKNNPPTTYGIDPAKNLYPISSGKGHIVSVDYFGSDWVDKNPGKGFDVIIAQNVFAHNYAPLDFLKAAKRIMSEDTLLFIQTSQADMIKNGEFDTIYHEHISFFNIYSMFKLCQRAGLLITDVTKCPLHGNSYIFTITKIMRNSRPANLINLIDMEKKAGLYNEKTYVEYAERANQIAHDLKLKVNGLRGESNPLKFTFVGYGAAAKGMTLLNFTDIKLDFIVDDNPLKQGKFTPGSSIPIVGPEEIDNLDSIVFVPLAWNFFDEIHAKIKERRNNPLDVFIKYFPKVEVTE